MSLKGFKNALIFIIVLFSVLYLIGNNVAFSQTWQALPPYNFLWPLWSPALSPIDPVTGLKAPLVNDLYPNTVLPLQPALAWNPIFNDPYFLYNSPVGLQYYDMIYGINPWPPSYVLDPITGGPLSINLPLGYDFLPPTDSLWIQQNLPLANLAYLAEYPNLALAAFNLGLPPNLIGLDPWLASLIYPTPAFSSLLTTAQILGYIPVTPVTSPIPPTVAAPVPTVIASPPAAITPVPTAVVPPPAVAAPAPTPVVPAPTVLPPPSPVVVTTPSATVILTNPATALNFIIFI